MNRSFLIASAILLGLAALPAGAVTLVDQPTNFNGAYSSQNDPSTFGNLATGYDNFTLSGDWDVTGVNWTGSYFNPSSPGTITNFTLTFYSDSSGQPGSSLFTESFSGNANETFLNTDNSGNPTYTYSAALATPFLALNATQYWLSIVPDLAYPPQWGWEVGTGGDGAAYQVFLGSGSSVGSDLAFSLTGDASATPAPEPISCTLGLMGLGALALAVRRKRAL